MSLTRFIYVGSGHHLCRAAPLTSACGKNFEENCIFQLTFCSLALVKGEAVLLLDKMKLFDSNSTISCLEYTNIIFWNNYEYIMRQLWQLWNSLTDIASTQNMLTNINGTVLTLVFCLTINKMQTFIICESYIGTFYALIT